MKKATFPGVLERERAAHSGFTLVELLVVMAIIGILVSLLLPAVQAAREAGRRAQCSTNMHNLGVAFIGYNTANRRLPGGGNTYNGGITYNSVDSRPVGPSTQNAGPFFQILPYLDETTTYNAGSATMTTTVPGYFCPTRRGPVQANTNLTVPVVTCVAPLSDYTVAVPGMFNGDVEEVSTYYSNNVLDSFGLFNKTVAGTVDIVVSLNGGVKDGVSNVMLAAEKWCNNLNYNVGDWGDCVGPYSGWCQDTARSAASPPMQDASTTITLSNGTNSLYIFGSAHQGTLTVLMADGSVRSVSYNVDQTLWRLMADRRDGTPIALP